MSAARNRYGFEGQSPDLEYQWWKVTNLTALQGKATKPRNNILYGEEYIILVFFVYKGFTLI